MKIHKFLTIMLLGVCVGSIQASEQVKITNSANVPVAFVLVQTEKDTDNRQLYTGYPGMPEEDIKTLVFNSMQAMKVFVLNPGESTTIANFPQKIMQYDRAVWVVALSSSDKKNIEAKLQALSTSVEARDAQNQVQAFEIGSAKTAQIVGDAENLSLNTTGKWLGGAKAFFKESKKENKKGSKPSQAERMATPGMATRGYLIDQVKQGTATNAIVNHIKNWKDAVAKSKKPAPKKAAKGKSIKYPNPEGWQDFGDAGVKLSFNDAVEALHLTPQQAHDIPRYSALQPGEKRSILKVLDREPGESKSKMHAKESLKSYLIEQPL